MYPSGSMKELGLNNDDLEKFLLGNWNSIVKDNKLLITNASEIDIDEEVDLFNLLLMMILLLAIIQTKPYKEKL